MAGLTPDRVALTVLEDTSPELGIDLVGRSHEIAKLLFAGFGSWIYNCHYEPQDVLQDVYRGLLARNIGRCPWDERKASFGHYVHRVCFCVLSNYHRKLSRRGQFEQIGVRSYGPDDTYGNRDVGEARHVPAPPTSIQEHVGIMEAQQSLQHYVRKSRVGPYRARCLSVRLVPLIYDGYTRTEMVRKTRTTRTRVNEAITLLQKLSVSWRNFAN